MKRQFLLKKTLFLALLCILFPGSLSGQKQVPRLFVSLKDTSGVSITGPYRFISIAGKRGLNVTSAKTMAFVRTSALDADKGSLSLWMSPLEDINLAHGTGLHDQFPVISDRFPSSDVDSCKFAIYYDGSGYPRMVARFTNGNFWGKMD